MTETVAQGVDQSVAQKKGGWKGWLAVAAIFIGLPVLGVTVLWKDRCTESLLGALPAPGDGVAAETALKDCGPSMKPATIVRLRDSRAAGEGAGVQDVLVLHGKTDVDLRWDGERQLSIGLPEGAVIVKRAREWRDMKVVFR